jgi:predicted RNA-binding protein YlxR (DUF448 family)
VCTVTENALTAIDGFTWGTPVTLLGETSEDVAEAQRELVRIVAGDGELVVDRDRRLPGRGVYLCPEPGCAEQARRRGAIPRKLRCTLTVPPDLEERVAIAQRDTSSEG